MDNPLISVYIPTRNRADALSRALLSIAQQTLKPMEVIIVDDGSGDNTPDVIRTFQDSTNIMVTVIKNPVSKGACAARNQAIAIAKGEFITGLDDDDEFTPERLWNLARNYSDQYSLIATSVFYRNGKSQKKHHGYSGIISLDDLLHYNKIGNQFYTRTERVRNLGGFDEAFPSFQDYDMLVRLVDRYGSALKIPAANYIVDCTNDNRISAKKNLLEQGFHKFFEKHKQKMQRRHIQSMRFLQKKILNESLSLFEALRLINMGNHQSVLYYWLGLTLSRFK